jgi:hypothetical protein
LNRPLRRRRRVGASLLRRAGIGVLAAAAVLCWSASAYALPTTTKTAVPKKATGYTYKQVGVGADSGFEAVGYDDSSWSTGTAGFGTTNGTCPFNNATDIGTPWDLDTDMLLRKTFTLPASATNLKVNGTVDNDATVYINGTQIGWVAHSGNCDVDAVNFSAADSQLVAGTNLLAVRGHDFGVAAYIDQQVTYDVPAYSLCLLYDKTKSHKLGSTVPLKIQLCDENGNNVSSSEIVVHAASLTKVDSSASGIVEDSGNANPGDDFRYDATLGGSGGYIFNKSTKGLSAGTWKLLLTIDGDSGYQLLFDVK